MEIVNTQKGARGNSRFAIKHSCLYLLLSLLLLLFAYPYGKVHPLIILSLNGMTLIAGIYAVGTIRHHIFIAATISVLQVLAAAIHLRVGFLCMDVIAAALFAVFYIYVMVIVLTYIVKGSEVTTDKILGVVSLYFLIGFTWASLFRMVYSLEPGAFSVSETFLTSTGQTKPDFVYFSFITLLTVGYGDIRPVSGIARSLAMLEGIVGVFYIGVFISRLLSIYRPQPEKTDPSE
jgi:hypothetical protein